MRFITPGLSSKEARLTAPGVSFGMRLKDQGGEV
jgi:hypothetical protein